MKRGRKGKYHGQVLYREPLSPGSVRVPDSGNSAGTESGNGRNGTFGADSGATIWFRLCGYATRIRMGDAVSNQMYETPYQDAKNYCGQCKQRAFARKRLDTGNLDSTTFGQLREKCSRCKQQDVGIYKADAILGVDMPSDAPKRPKLPPGKGKASIIPPETIKAILSQIKSGVSNCEIARRTGYSEKTIRNIKKRNLTP